MQPPPTPPGLDAAWADWIADAPRLVVDKRGDAYVAEALRWLRNAPTHRPASADARNDVKMWLIRYEQRLDGALAKPGDVNTDDLKKAAIGLAGSIGSPIVAAKAGLAGAALVGAATGFGLAVIAVGFGAVAVRRGTVQRRRANMIGDVRQELARVFDSL